MSRNSSSCPRWRILRGTQWRSSSWCRTFCTPCDSGTGSCCTAPPPSRSCLAGKLWHFCWFVFEKQFDRIFGILTFIKMGKVSKTFDKKWRTEDTLPRKVQEPGSCAVEFWVDEAVEIVEGAGVLLPLDVLVTRVRPQGQRHRDPVINLLHQTITARTDNGIN